MITISNPEAELKITKNEQNHSETYTILADFKKLQSITIFIGDLLENIESRELERIIDNHKSANSSQTIYKKVFKSKVGLT